MDRFSDFIQSQPRFGLLVAGIGIFFCTIVVLIGTFVAFQHSGSQAAGPLATSGVTPAPAEQPTVVRFVATATRQGAVAVSPQPPATTVVMAAATPTAAQTEPQASPTPYFSAICFRTQTIQDSPVNCQEQFGGDTVEIKAVFDYAALQPGQHNWTRVWYHQGQEVLRVKDAWTGDVEGQFEYSLNTTDGQPLSPGDWQLELYINDELESFGNFLILEALAAPTASPTPAVVTPTPQPIAGYQLLYTRWDGGKHQIWVANLDGSETRFLLDFAASPSWAPDGTQIAFYGQEGVDTQAAVTGGTNGIWRMAADGQLPTQLLPEGTGHMVTWSPTGDAIAFDAARGGPDRRVYFVDPGGNVLPYEALGEHPSFSPDGQEIVVKLCAPDCGLWISERNGAGLRQLTNDGSDGLPAWSPRGDQIAFSRNIDGNVDLFTIRPDGSGLQRLTNAPGNDSVPAWTPDGRQMAFRSTRNGLWQIFVMDADGTNQRMIIDAVGASDEWAFDRMSIR